jgi:hypothetical protein
MCDARNALKSARNQSRPKLSNASPATESSSSTPSAQSSSDATGSVFNPTMPG